MIDLAVDEEEISRIHHSLRATRRRYVIQLLYESDDISLTTRTLARKITSMEKNLPPWKATGEPYRNTYNALSQTHLPTLSEANIIIYDADRQEIEPGKKFPIAVLLMVINRTIVIILDGDTQ